MGLRRRGPRLTPSPATRAPRAVARAVALVAPLLLAAACGMTDAEQQRFSLHQRNSQEFYSQGSYQQAVQQAEMALTFDSDAVGMRLMRGFCLTKLGEARDDVAMLDQAVDVLEDLLDDDDEDYRVWLGAGQAHLARAMAGDDAIGRIEWRLGSDYIDDAGRELETASLESERRARERHLERAEECLRRVLDFELQGDNAYALIELALVLNVQGDRDEEALAFSQRAVEQLVQSNELANDTLQGKLDLSPSFALSLEKRIQDNLVKERVLRDTIAHLHYRLGDDEAAIDALDALERRQLIKAAHYEFRATLHERQGHLDEAVRDLESFLRLRSRTVAFDEVAAETFDRIDRLVARGAQPAGGR